MTAQQVVLVFLPEIEVGVSREKRKKEANPEQLQQGPGGHLGL